MASQNTPDIGQLLQNANDDGVLSQVAMQSLNVVDLGTQIQAGIGIDADDVEASEVVLVTIMPDDSASILYAGNAEAVKDGANIVPEALKASKQNEGVLVHNRLLNGQVLYPYQPLDAVIEMDGNNYNPSGGTPLYDQSIILLGTVIAKAQEFSDNGIPVRTVTLIISDGGDTTSRTSTARDVAAIVGDMLKAENHIVAAMGVEDGSTDFKQVFGEMGIPDEWILTPGNSPTEIRKAFQVFSKSAVAASQSGTSFSETAIGGFGTP